MPFAFAQNNQPSTYFVSFGKIILIFLLNHVALRVFLKHVTLIKNYQADSENLIRDLKSTPNHNQPDNVSGRLLVNVNSRQASRLLCRGVKFNFSNFFPPSPPFQNKFFLLALAHSRTSLCFTFCATLRPCPPGGERATPSAH